MKKSLYYRATFARPNKVKAAILQFFFSIASYPRLLLEVFIRSNFGERYFSLHSFIFLFFALFLLPFGLDSAAGYYNQSGTILRHFVWYGYLAGFLYFGIKRDKEIRLKPGVFDFSRFSLSTGQLDPKIKQFWDRVWLKFFNGQPSPRTMEIYLEPLPFFILGLLCLPFDTAFGLLMTVCSTLYSFSFMAAYWIGDNLIMDLIDELLVAEETKRIVVEDKEPKDTRGVNFRFRKPVDPDRKEQLADSLVEDDEPASSVF